MVSVSALLRFRGGFCGFAVFCLRPDGAHDDDERDDEQDTAHRAGEERREATLAELKRAAQVGLDVAAAAAALTLTAPTSI